MNTFHSTIERIRQTQSQLVALKQKIAADVQELEKMLKDRFDDRWKHWFGDVPKYSIVSTTGGSHTDEWEPNIWLYHVAGKKLTDQGFWVDQEAEDESYDFELKPVQAPINREALKTMIEEFKLETGVSIEVVMVTVKTGKPERITDARDMRAFFGPEFKELVSGKVWYPGWEIPDHFVLGMVGQRYVAMFSSFMDDNKLVRTKEEFQDFFKHLDDRDLDGFKPGEFKAKYEAQVMETF